MAAMPLWMAHLISTMRQMIAKRAFRVVGHASDQDDPTDYVYYKNYYIAPSYNLT